MFYNYQYRIKGISIIKNKKEKYLTKKTSKMEIKMGSNLELPNS